MKWSRPARAGLALLAAPALMLQGSLAPAATSAAHRPAGVIPPPIDAVVAEASAGQSERLTAESALELVRAPRPAGQPLNAGGASRPHRPAPALLVRLIRSLRATSRPGGRKVVGVVPAGSKYYRTPTVAWVLDLSPKGRYGRVPIPYTSKPRTGWIPLRGLKRSHTPFVVRADLSRHGLTVTKLGHLVLRVPMATGAPASPTPPGRYFVTDRVPFNPGGALGAFAFGISGIQPHLPAGWRGGNQLAIHGTNNPASIGSSASAGCLRVSRATLERLKRILILGTPVIIQA